MNSDLVFVYLGSGEGKLVVQAYMEIESKALKRCIGVELPPVCHNIACDAWRTIRKKARAVRERRLELSSYEQYFTYNATIVEFVQGDMLKINLPSATHIFISSLCFLKVRWLVWHSFCFFLLNRLEVCNAWLLCNHFYCQCC